MSAAVCVNKQLNEGKCLSSCEWGAHRDAMWQANRNQAPAERYLSFDVRQVGAEWVILP